MSAKDVDVPNLSGRLAVVTGASDGLGLRLAHRLARAGAELILPVRNERKGAEAVAAITRAVPAATVSLLVYTATPGTPSHSNLALLAVVGDQPLSRG
jgi:NAD(P)-dependent dehydrogenase (short-subunit alcohol dehydrogenase family)